jgi:hypothetical protein
MHPSQPSIDKHKKTTFRGGFLIVSSRHVSTCYGRQQMVEKVLPGIALFSQGAAPQLSLPLLRFTPEFEMDRGGSTTLWTPG